MPISIDSDVWQSAEKGESMRHQALQFLQEHPESAFHAHEICDTVADTNWSEIHEEWRMMDEIGKDEYLKEHDTIQGTDEWHDATDALDVLRPHLGALIASGDIEYKQIPEEESEVPLKGDPLYYHISDQ